MELEEFRELALQSLPRLSRGRTVRYTLVRTPGEFFISKIHRQQYLDLRSIPVMKNYRFIQSSLTHAEYSAFKEDFTDDLDFLRIRDEPFSKIIGIAESMGFMLYGFSSSGNGRIDVKSPGRGLGSGDLKNLLNENREKGIRPFLLTFKKGKHKVTVRKDFNYFIHGGYWDSLEFVYRTSTAIIDSELHLLERLSRLRLRSKADRNDFLPLDRMEYRLRSGLGKMEVLSRIKQDFTLGEIRNSEATTSLYAFQKASEKSLYRLDISDEAIEFLPTVGSGIEGALELLESVETGVSQ